MAWKGERKKKVVDFILNEIESGRSVRSIFRGEHDIKLPSRKTFNEWLKDDNELSDQYTRACETRQDGIFEDILDISDFQGKDVYKDKDGNEITDYNVIARSRLMVDSRKWMLGKMNPKKYGDTTRHKHSGDEDDDTPIKIIGTIIK